MKQCVEFDTRPYVTAYLHEPRGRGSWFFDFPGDKEPWFAKLEKHDSHGTYVANSLTYAEAKRAAKAEAKRRFPREGYVKVRVCS